ncbi:rRNA methyltransferase 3, mitochondrial [Calliopsis andreniformis]|uniref:rRNA methyltransferase 3, mitochondrial n=1 Tax=Calliopsis andreniformis TaxID=337506 RepID=UPI003FCC4806
MVLFNSTCKILRPLRHLTILQTNNTKLDITRTYARFVSRRPVAIVNEDELYETEDTTIAKVPQIRANTSRRSKKKELPKESAEEPQIEEKKSRFTVLKHDDKLVNSLMTKVKSRKLKEKNDEIILEGRRLIQEGLKAGVEPTAIFFNNPSDIDTLQLPENVKLYKVPYRTIQLWSSLTTSPGLIGIFKTPDVHNRNPANDSLPLTIICDNVRDPGNLGAIMRAAAGVGCEKLILMKGCVDLWHVKVLRSAAGTHFRLPIHTNLTWDEIPSLINEYSNVFLAESNFGDEFISEYTPDMLQPSMGVFNIKPSSFKENFDNVYRDGKWKSPEPTNKRMMKKFLLSLPIVPYYALDYTENEIVFILSGETEGLSLDSYKFLHKTMGIRVNIPLLNGVDSLNTGVALGIVTFEMKRQFIKKQSEHE